MASARSGATAVATTATTSGPASGIISSGPAASASVPGYGRPSAAKPIQHRAPTISADTVCARV